MSSIVTEDDDEGNYPFKDNPTEGDTAGIEDFPPPPGSTAVPAPGAKPEDVIGEDKEKAATAPVKEEKKDEKPKEKAEVKIRPVQPVGGIIWKVLIFISMCVASFIVSVFIQSRSGFGAQVGSAQLYPTFTPSATNDGLNQLLNIISQAEKEIVVVAKEANSIDFLNALATQQKNKRLVVVVLDKEFDSVNKNRSPSNYLRTNGLPESNIFLSAQSLSSQYVIIDRKAVWMGTMTFNAKGQTYASEGLFLQNKSLADTFYANTIKLIKQAKGE